MKSRVSSRSSDGWLLFEAAVVSIMVMLAAASILRVYKSQGDLAHYAGGIPAFNSAVDESIATFQAAPYAAAPTQSASAFGTTDSGKTLYITQDSWVDVNIGLTGYAASAFTAGDNYSVLGGALRLDALPSTNWRPESTDVPIGPSTHQLIVKAGNTTSGGVSGTGAYSFGTSIPIVATPNPGKTFIRWDGTAVIANRNLSSTTVTIDEDRTVTAIFGP